MVNIIYRHYIEGDDEQLADLFMKSFQMNGAGFARTAKTWNWRYAQSPGFEPEQCQLAEDTDNNLLVGAIYVNLVETIPLNGKPYITGDINDVSCHPDYTGQGIAKKLMDMSVDYMEKKNCDISMLTADYNGFPRKKIYLKYGYEDVDRNYIFFYVTNPLKLFRDLPAIGVVLPVLLFGSYVPRFLSRIRIRFNPFFKNFSCEIAINRNHYEYMEAANRIMPKNYTGWPGYTKESFKWAHINVPAERYKPTYTLLQNNNKVIGGALLTYSNIYAFKYGIKIRVGVLHEIFLDKSEFDTRRNLHLGYTYLIDKIVKAAHKRKIGGIFVQTSGIKNELYRGFRGMNFFNFRGASVMIKTMKKNIQIPKFKKPLFVPTYVNKGIP